MQPTFVVPLVHDLGTTDGHRLVLLSVEVYDDAADLRFARIDVGADTPLPRRVPPADAWAVSVDGVRATVVDAVGRGDRGFSNGEVRFTPPPGRDARVQVRVRLVDDGPNLHATLDLGASRDDGSEAP